MSYKTLLHAIAKNDKDFLKNNIKSQKDLERYGKKGISVLCFLAKKGLLSTIDSSLISKELLGKYNSEGINAYIYAAYGNAIKHIPRNLINDKVLRLNYKNGPDVFMMVQKHRQLKDLPEHCFSQSLLLEKRNGMNPRIVGLTYSGQLDAIPKKFLKPEIVLKGGKGTESHNSLLHIAAHGGCLNAFPKSLITEKNLLTLDIYGNTVIHTAAYHGNLKQIPQEFLTKENIFRKNQRKENVIHHSIIGHCLEEIPMNFLTKNALRIKSNDKGDVFAHINHKIGDCPSNEMDKYYGKRFHQRIKDIWKYLDNEDLNYANTYPNLKKFSKVEKVKRNLPKEDYIEI